MKEIQFRQWLWDNGYQNKVVESRVTNVRKIEEVYPDLDSRIEDGTIVNLLSAFTYTASDRKNNREPLHKIQINGDQYSGTATYKNALKLYVSFYNKVDLQPIAVVQKMECKSEYVSSKRDEIYRIEDFKEWLCSKDGKTGGTAASYVSHLNFLNGKLRMKDNSINNLIVSSHYLKKGEVPRALRILDEIDEVLSAKLVSGKVLPCNDRKRFNDARSSLRKYRQFLEEELEDIPDKEEFGETNLEILQDGVKEEIEGFSVPLVYSYSDIEANFCFRLMTQNRMSNDKDIFFPIGIIRKLFRYRQRKARGADIGNKDYEWFKHWIKDCVAEVGVVTENGIVTLAQLQRLVINPIDKSVWAIMNDANGSSYTVLTEVGDNPKVIAQMRSVNIQGIHIDHTPSMATVLSENRKTLFALNTLSHIIRGVAKKHRINIKPANFGEISRKLFADSERVEIQLLPLISSLKEELEFLKNKCELKLMQAKYNLVKK